MFSTEHPGVLKFDGESFQSSLKIQFYKSLDLFIYPCLEVITQCQAYSLFGERRITSSCGVKLQCPLGLEVSIWE